MTYVSIILVVLNIGLVGVGLAYSYSRLASGGRSDDAQNSIEADAKRTASLFEAVRETLSVHASGLKAAQEFRNVDQVSTEDPTPSIDVLRKQNREAADSLDANGKKLEVLLEQYGGLYRSERGRIEQYAQQTKELDKQLSKFEQDADGSNKVLLQLVREMLQENTQLRSKVTSCQEQVSELIVQSVKSDREARTDSLTRLPNRRAWDERLATIDLDGNTSVAFIDVDNFKFINDQYGHAAGDGMLTLIGTILSKSPQVSAYRLGGDEFALIIHESSGQDEDRIVDRLRDRIAMSVLQFKGEKIKTTVSVGVARGTVGEPIESILFRADNALYASKEAGGNQVQSNLNATPAVAVGTGCDMVVNA